MLIDENNYDELIIKLDELDYKVKNDLSLKIIFDEKYNRKIYLELCQLIGYQIDKVTRSFETLNENDIESTLNDIKKTWMKILKNYLKIVETNFYVLKN